jgi:hypothetical protein
MMMGEHGVGERRGGAGLQVGEAKGGQLGGRVALAVRVQAGGWSGGDVAGDGDSVVVVIFVAIIAVGGGVWFEDWR